MSTRRRFLGWLGLSGAVAAVATTPAIGTPPFGDDLAPIDVRRIKVEGQIAPEIGEIVYAVDGYLAPLYRFSGSRRLSDLPDPFGMFIGTERAHDDIWLVAVGRGDYGPSEHEV